ncbi:hypothetical protein C5H24_12535 [Xylella fastidiosa]|nr:hypothetical protein C5H24_12535 [Xylella fastidiosa]
MLTTQLDAYLAVLLDRLELELEPELEDALEQSSKEEFKKKECHPAPSLFLPSSSTVSGSMFANVFRSMWYFDVRRKIQSERTTYSLSPIILILFSLTLIQKQLPFLQEKKWHQHRSLKDLPGNRVG